jgi:hypothetical protein
VRAQPTSLRVYTLAFALQMSEKSTRDIIWTLWVPKAWGPEVRCGFS